MHPDLMQAIVLAAIVTMPDHPKRQLVSSVPARRERAEEVLAAAKRPNSNQSHMLLFEPEADKPAADFAC